MPDGPISPDFNIGSVARLPANEISMQAAKNFPQPESKAHIPDIRMELDPNKKAGQSGSTPENVGPTPEQVNELLQSPERSGERENSHFMELELLDLMTRYEKAEGGSETRKLEGQKYSLENQLANRLLDISKPLDVLKTRPGAHLFAITIEDGKQKEWYAKVPGRFGLESVTVGKSSPIGGVVYTEYTYLGSEDDRNVEREQLNKFSTEYDARNMFASLFAHYKRNIENIGGLSALYLLSQEVKPEQVHAMFSLPCLPEDENRKEPLKSLGNVEFDKGVELGQMSAVAMQIFEAVGLCEKRELFKDYVQQPAFSRVINLKKPENQAQPINVDETDPSMIDLSAPLPDLPDQPPPLNPSIFESKVFKDWFGKPDEWRPNAPKDDWKGLNATERAQYRTEKEWETEKANGSRGKFTGIAGNVMAKDDDPTYPRKLREKVAEFLGNSPTAKLAVEMGWRNYRLFGCASQVGYEWYPDSGWEDGLMVKIPLGQDVADDFGKVLRIDGYDWFYKHYNRGPFPKGEHNQLTPLATDILRALPFNYKVNYKDEDEIPSRKTLYTAIFRDGILPNEINTESLFDRSISGGYLRIFMATGGEYGKGSLDILAAPVGDRPDPYLEPSYWETLQSKLKVGVTKDTYATYVRETKLNSPRKGASLPDPNDLSSSAFEVGFNEYKLEKIRTRLDGIFAEAESAKWDTDVKSYGKQDKLTRGKHGIAAQTEGKFDSARIIDVANETLPGLSYNIMDPERLTKARKIGNIPTI